MKNQKNQKQSQPENAPVFKDKYELSREKVRQGEHPSTDAYFTNPVASATDCTGFAVTIPHNNAEAKSLSHLCGDVPVTSHKEKGVKDSGSEKRKK